MHGETFVIRRDERTPLDLINLHTINIKVQRVSEIHN